LDNHKAEMPCESPCCACFGDSWNDFGPLVMRLARTPDIKSIKRDFVERAEAFLAVGVTS
jgi:hypothetical protein